MWLIFVRPATPISNVGVAVVLAPRVSLHVPVPVHGPDHPAKVVPGSAAGVKTTAVPAGKLAVHFPGQSMPAGVLITLPAVAPAPFTVSWTEAAELVAALAMQDIPHKPRNNTRQKKLPRQDLDVDITPPRRPVRLSEILRVTVAGEGSGLKR
jgi:hypothetical protein